MRRGTTRGTGMLAVAAGAVLVLAGCTATAAPGAEPTGEAVEQSIAPTATSTPTATPTASVAPESIKPELPEYEVSDAGAEAFAEYFLMLYPYVYATGDLTQWTAISDPECVFCRSVVDNVTKQLEAGNTSSGGLVTVNEVSARKISDGMYAVDAEVSQGASEELGPDGTVVDSSEPSTPTIMLALLPGPGAWTVRAVQVDEAPGE